MANLDSVLKSRDITLPKEFHLVKAMVFPVVTYGCESWTVKKAERWNIDAFELWCWRRLLIVPWTARRSNQCILMEINRDYSLEGLMLKFLYFGHLMRRADSLEKTLMLGGIGGRRRRGRQRMRWLDGVTDPVDMGLSISGSCSPWGSKESDLSDRTAARSVGCVRGWVHAGLTVLWAASQPAGGVTYLFHCVFRDWNSPKGSLS